jgi:hypothetical protein
MLLTAAKASGVDNGNPYFIALIALAGVVGGAAIAAVTQYFTGKSASQSQSAALNRWFEHSKTEAVNTERRRAYARYLTAMNAYQLLTVTTFGAVSSGEHAPDNTRERNEFSLALSEVQLLATQKVSYIAGDMFNNLMQRMSLAMDGRNPDETVREGVVYPKLVYAAM